MWRYRVQPALFSGVAVFVHRGRDIEESLSKTRQLLDELNADRLLAMIMQPAVLDLVYERPNDSRLRGNLAQGSPQ